MLQGLTGKVSSRSRAAIADNTRLANHGPPSFAGKTTPSKSSRVARISCRASRQDMRATRELLEGVVLPAKDGGPWFARRVLSAIAARERELTFPVSPWSMVPRFASRLAWASAIVLLAGSTWLYQKATPVPAKQPAAASSPEYLFEAPQPPMNQDDVLISMAEKNQ